MSDPVCKLPIGFVGQIVATVVYTSLSIAGSLGNVLIILTIYRTPNLKTVCGVLISNVAVADLMITAIVMPIVVFTLVQGFLEQCLYNTPISIALLVALFSATASLLILTLLSMDRCFAICKPMKHKTMVTSTRVKIIVAKTWIESFALPLLVVFFRDAAATKYLQTLGVVGCYSVILGSGFLTVKNVRTNSMQIGTLHSDQGSSRTTADLSQRNKQVAKTIAIVVILFTLCWIPIAFVISLEIPDPEGRVYFWFAVLGLANSSVNPWIYFYRQSNYRNALKKLLGCKQSVIKKVVSRPSNKMRQEQ